MAEPAGDLVLTAANALIGGISAGALRSARGGDFWRGFRTGAAGGAVAFAGRRVATEPFTGAGLLGRQIGALGSSMVDNGARGRPAFERIVLPLGPLYLHLQPRSGWNARLKLDVPTTAAIAWYALQRNTTFDAHSSLSSGVPVFASTVRFADGFWQGAQFAGVIHLTGNPQDPAPDASRAAVLAHERVHVLQHDFGMLVWSDPLESRLLAGSGTSNWLHDRVALGLHLGAWQLANWLVPYGHRPWEAEAHYLSRVQADR